MAHVAFYIFASISGVMFLAGALATAVRVVLGLPDDGSATFALSFLAAGSVLFNIGTIACWLERPRP